ncbi:dicarboxylate/amino acid:cation symporter [Aquabacterium sp. A3]|uniref:dicarboxylate/amino acid:cation symporter n=1 Tax=Aquabacterium sp. A3 TaxID=3132829 RepID=UPI00311A1413
MSPTPTNPTTPVKPALRPLTRRLRGFVRTRLWLQVLVAMALGLGVGLGIGPWGQWLAPAAANTLVNWLALPGSLFLSLVQMIVIPLVVASIMLGICSNQDTAQLQRMGLRTAAFFVLTTLLAAIIGLGVVLLIEPGQYARVDHLSATAPLASAPADASQWPSRLLGLIPTNPLRAGVEQNMLQVVVFAMLLGVAMLKLPAAQARPITELLTALQELSMVVVRWAMYLVPAAVFGMMVQLVVNTGLEALWGVGAYVGAVLLALVLAFGMMLALYAVLCRRSPWQFLQRTRDVLLLAFSTSSSAAVMPLTLRTAEEQLGVSTAVSRFVIPMGATVNMAGTALYQVMATLFLAQVFDVSLGLSGLLVIVVLAVGASIGSPGTPGIGIVILSMLLGSAGIPAEGLALIIGVDRILDMSRTTLNVAGDLVAACVVDHSGQPTG